ncbi:hypothetical protein GCM10010307_70680 [Streptomyces vastus]|uniref:Spore-associated protein A n=1 Tax=Streptomyces vastus TaxID=285451 RepID=A0ABP6E4Z3_9ACTN
MVAPAQAASGDRTIQYDDNNVRLGTNQCAESHGSFVPLGGAPGSPSGLIATASSGTGNCSSRIRIVYVERWNGPVRQTARRTAGPGSATVVAADSGFRCYVEFGVRRNDGTYFTRFMISPNRPAGCPS